jgi:hypothetical protein
MLSLCWASPPVRRPIIRQVLGLHLLDMVKLAPLQLTISRISQVCMPYHIPIS